MKGVVVNTSITQYAYASQILSSNGLLMEKAVSLAYRVGNGQQHFNLPFWNWYLLGGKMTKRRFWYFAKC